MTMQAGAIVVAIIIWLGCGWLGGKMIGRVLLTSGWAAEDEVLARLLLLTGPAFLIAGVLMLWLSTHPPRKSWFGKKLTR